MIARFVIITSLILASAALGWPQMHYAVACMVAAILINPKVHQPRLFAEGDSQ